MPLHQSVVGGLAVEVVQFVPRSAGEEGLADEEDRAFDPSFLVFAIGRDRPGLVAVVGGKLVTPYIASPQSRLHLAQGNSN